MIHDEMETVVKTYGINTFKHFMAYKGALMVNDDELYNSFRAARSWVPAAGPCRERRCRRPHAAGFARPRRHRPRGPFLFPARRSRGRGANRAIMIADMAAVRSTSCMSPASRRMTRSAAPSWRPARLWRAAGAIPRARRFRSTRTRTGTMPRPGDDPPFRNKKHQDSLWAGLQSGTLSSSPPTIAPSRANAEAHRRQELHHDPQRHGRP